MQTKLLSRKSKEKVLEELTYFEVPVHIPTGAVMEEIEPDGDTRLFKGFDDEGEEFVSEYEDVVILQFNNEVRTRVGKYSRYVLGTRGIKDVDSIGLNDAEVKSILQKKRTENRGLTGKASLSDQDKMAAIQIVRQKHEPQYTAVIFEVIIWAMMRDDVFNAVNVKGQKGLECRFDIELDEELFEPKNDNDSLDDIFLGEELQPIVRDKTQPIELAIAICKQLTNNNESFGERVGELAGIVFSNLALTSGDVDDEQIFRDTVVGVLPDYLVKTNTSFNGERLRGGVFFSSKKDKKLKSRVEEEVDEFN